MIIGNHPGPWHLFLKRPDNQGLHILEVKQKYLKEQVNYENQLSQYLYMMSFQPKGPGGGIIDNTVNSFVEDDYVEDYFL